MAREGGYQWFDSTVLSPPPATVTPMPALTPLDRAILDFERENTWWAFEGRRESAIREAFGLDRDIYDLNLYRLIQRPEALVYDSLTVNRLRRRVESKRVRRRDG